MIAERVPSPKMQLSLAFVLSTMAICSVNGSGLQPQKYKGFAPGVVKPSGWARNQAYIQAKGLQGNQPNSYSYVANSTWTGGTVEYSLMDEAAPYWFNGVVALAFQIDDEKLKVQAKSFLDYLLTSQGQDGWLGPIGFSNPRLIWPRYLVLLGLIQYAEADAAETERIVKSMHRFVSLVHDIFVNGTQGDPDAGFQYDYQYVRWEELVYSLQWLHDNHPRGQESNLLETMKLVREQGASWKEDWYTSELFPREAVEIDTHFTHGVNTGESIKSEAVAWRFTSNQTDRQSTYDRINLINTYHGKPSGCFACDEHLAGLNPSRGTETCTVVETMFSLEVNYQIFGENSWADQIERLAYNSLPAALLPDMTARQYLQQDNQIWSKNRSANFIWEGHSDNSYSGVFGEESNYPCCTTNFPQGFPKFWANSFVLDPLTNTLAHVLLGPATFESTLSGGNHVKITVDTQYPFDLKLQYTIEASQDTSFAVRIPGWSLSSSTISHRGKTVAITPNSSTSLQSITCAAGLTVFAIQLDAAVEIESRANGSIAISRGPLMYAVDLAYNETIVTAIRAPAPLDYLISIENLTSIPSSALSTIDPHGRDHYLYSTVPWQIAIDPSTLALVEKPVAHLDYFVWRTGSQPVTMTAMACEIDWPLVKDDPDWPPQGPNQCIGRVFNVTLVPFGGTRLRIGQIPTMSVA